MKKLSTLLIASAAVVLMSCGQQEESADTCSEKQSTQVFLPNASCSQKSFFRRGRTWSSGP